MQILRNRLRHAILTTLGIATLLSGAAVNAESPSFNINTGILRIPYLEVPGVASFWIEFKDTGGLVFALHAGDVVPTVSPLVGTWKVGPNPAPDGGSEIYFIFEKSGKFVFMEGDGELPNGMEGGTYAHDSASGRITMTKAYDYNSDGGLYESPNDVTAIMNATISGDTLTLMLGPMAVTFQRQ